MYRFSDCLWPLCAFYSFRCKMDSIRVRSKVLLVFKSDCNGQAALLCGSVLFLNGESGSVRDWEDTQYNRLVHDPCLLSPSGHPGIQYWLDLQTAFNIICVCFILTCTDFFPVQGALYVPVLHAKTYCMKAEVKHLRTRWLNASQRKLWTRNWGCVLSPKPTSWLIYH